MARTRSSSVVVALLLAVLAFTGPAAGARKQQSSLFQRVTRALQGAGSAVTGIGSGSAVDEMGGALTSMLDEQQQQARPGVDTWATDGVLTLALQAFKGGQLGVLGQLGQAEELKELWSQPEGVRMLLDNFALFRGIKKMAAIADKEGPLTPEDGLAALGAFQEYIQASAAALEGVLDPGKFAEKIYDYQTTKEPGLRALFEQVEAGDVEAIFALQEELLKREMGDIVDLEEFGLRGEEPEAVRALRDMIQAQDPDIYRLITQDDEPSVRRLMADPGAAFKDAQALDPQLAKVAEAIKAGSRRQQRRRERRDRKLGVEGGEEGVVESVAA